MFKWFVDVYSTFVDFKKVNYPILIVFLGLLFIIGIQNLSIVFTVSLMYVILPLTIIFITVYISRSIVENILGINLLGFDKILIKQDTNNIQKFVTSDSFSRNYSFYLQLGNTLYLSVILFFMAYLAVGMYYFFLHDAIYLTISHHNIFYLVLFLFVLLNVVFIFTVINIALVFTIAFVLILFGYLFKFLTVITRFCEPLSNVFFILYMIFLENSDTVEEFLLFYKNNFKCFNSLLMNVKLKIIPYLSVFGVIRGTNIRVLISDFADLDIERKYRCTLRKNQNEVTSFLPMQNKKLGFIKMDTSYMSNGIIFYTNYPFIVSSGLRDIFPHVTSVIQSFVSLQVNPGKHVLSSEYKLNNSKGMGIIEFIVLRFLYHFKITDGARSKLLKEKVKVPASTFVKKSKKYVTNFNIRFYKEGILVDAHLHKSVSLKKYLDSLSMFYRELEKVAESE